jgi:hypothetical protein
MDRDDLAILTAMITSRLIIALAGLALIVRPAEADEITAEYRLKAAYLYNFAKFVDWPYHATPSLTLCVVGRDPFGSLLDEVMSGKSVAGRRIETRRLKGLNGIAQCDMLFVASSEAKRLPAILESGGNQPVLTIGESPGFAAAGGMIGLVLSDGKLRFEINLAAAERARLRISSSLLRLGTIVETGRRSSRVSDIIVLNS